jgi:predicted dehydrogenase
MSSSIRLAVIGAGHLGRFHARLAAAMESFDLIGVVDPQPEARRSLAEEVGVAAFPSHTAVLDKIDAAVVATPTQSHHDVGRDLLSAGIHTLIEKPLASTTAQAQSLVQCAAARQRVLQVGHIERFNPAFVAARQEIDSPKYIEARRYSGYSFRSTDIGVVMDVMIHDLDLVLSLVDSAPETIDALGVSVMGQHEDVADVRLGFPDGCVAHLTASRVSYCMAREMQVWAPEGFTAIHFAEPSATIVRPSAELLRSLPDAEAMPADEKLAAKDRFFEDYLPKQRMEPEPCNALADELKDFAEAIHCGRPPRVTGEAGLRAVALCEQILMCIDEHAWDGRADGRRGPLAAHPPTTIRPPHWADDLPHRRRAG